MFPSPFSFPVFRRRPVPVKILDDANNGGGVAPSLLRLLLPQPSSGRSIPASHRSGGRSGAGILKHWEAGELALISSEVLTLEVDETKDPDRRAFVCGILDRADEFVELNELIAARAKVFESAGLRAMDALHLACAEAVAVDHLSTCDDRFLKKARACSDVKVSVVSLRELFDKVFP